MTTTVITDESTETPSITDTIIEQVIETTSANAVIDHKVEKIEEEVDQWKKEQDASLSSLTVRHQAMSDQMISLQSSMTILSEQMTTVYQMVQSIHQYHQHQNAAVTPEIATASDVTQDEPAQHKSTTGKDAQEPRPRHRWI